MYFGRIASTSGGGGGGEPTIPGQLTLIYDDFSGSSLNSRWKIRRPDMTTVTVSGGYARVQVDTDTIPQMAGYSYSNITTQAMIYDTSFGLNCRRNYTLEQGFYIDKINDTTLGAFTGPYCPFPVDYPFSGFGHYQFSGPDTIRVLGGKDTMFTYPPAGHSQTSAVPVNTTDYYVLRFTVFENEAKVTFINRTTGDSVSKIVNFQMTSGGWLARPSYFYYAFGLMGRSIVRYDYMHVYTPEELNPAGLIIADSKGAGYNANTADSAYGNMLKRNTADSIQVYAGGGMGVDEVLLVLKDVWRINPDYVIFDIGTNNTFNSTNYGRYARIIDSLTAHGITSYKLMQPNGGNPVGGGGWNQWIKDTYGSTYIDDWTTGWNTWSTGNGKMYDGVHNTLSGTQSRYVIIKTALPSKFPL
jgi:hypothetical protein